MPDRSAPLHEPRPDIPQNFQKEKDISSDRLYDEDNRTDLQKFFNLYPDEDQEDIAINAFLAECKQAKYAHFNKTFDSYSIYEPNLDEIVNKDAEKQSIIHEEGSPCPKPNVAHLSPSKQTRINKIVARHEKLFSRSKHHLGKFTGFQAKAYIDKKSTLN